MRGVTNVGQSITLVILPRPASGNFGSTRRLIQYMIRWQDLKLLRRSDEIIIHKLCKFMRKWEEGASCPMARRDFEDYFMWLALRYAH